MYTYQEGDKYFAEAYKSLRKDYYIKDFWTQRYLCYYK